MASTLKFVNKLPSNLRSISTTKPRKDAWLSKIFVRKIEPTKEPHSRMLSDKEIIYALQTHNYRPDSKKAYLSNIIVRIEIPSGFNFFSIFAIRGIEVLRRGGNISS